MTLTSYFGIIRQAKHLPNQIFNCTNMRSKSRLKLGKASRKTISKRNKNKFYSALTWIRTDDEIFNRITYDSCSNRMYSPHNPSVKTFKKTIQNSPRKPATPKGRKLAKRISTSTRSKEPQTPSKSPSSKKVRRSLYSAESNTEHESIDENVQVLTEADVTQSSNAVLQAEIDELTKLVPSVMENLSDGGYDQEMLKFFKMVNDSSFPLSNIAFQLWMEVVKWFGCKSTTEMRYSEQTKKFWKLGYRTFGGQFLYFMSGFKNQNTVVRQETRKGIYPPCQSEINFAVPGQDILRNFSPYNVEICQDKSMGRHPGLLTDMIESLASAPSNDSFCLTFDGKKIKRGLTKSSGDVDLLGFEQDITLKDRKEQTESMKRPVEQLIVEICDRDELQNINSDVPENEKKKLAEILCCQLKNISLNTLSARQLRKKKEYAKEKLIERRGGSDWKNGKYVLGISAHIAFIHDIDEYLRESVTLVDEITKCVSCLNGSSEVLNKNEINIEECNDYKAIKVSCQPTSRQVKQRNEEWFDHRCKAKVTGSTIYAALGLDGLSKQKEHFDTTIGGLPEKSKPETVKSAMKHGTENEVNAAATMVGKVLPMLCPGKRMYEEGFVKIESTDDSSFMIVSPDGSVRSADDEECTTMGIELKCPVFDVQRSFPERYLLQCLSEIEALNVESLLYLCWRPDISTVFKIYRNTTLFENAFTLAESLYNTERPKRPTKLSDETKLLKEKIVKACKAQNIVEFIGVFPSLKHNSKVVNTYDNNRFLIRRLEVMLNQTLTNHDKFHELQRQPATEAIVFLCCDLDRKWEKNTVQSAPVCWFPKGSSLETSTMRKIFEWVLDECKKADIHVPAASFDGQWHNIAVKDVNENPLTLLQLQKDVWRKVEKMTKSDQLKEMSMMNKAVKIIASQAAYNDLNNVVCTNGGLVLPRISRSVVRNRLKGTNKPENTYEKDPANDIVSEQQNGEEDVDNEADEYVDTGTDIGQLSNKMTNKTNTDLDIGTQVPSVPEHVERITTELKENDFDTILRQLKLDKHCNAKNQWNDKCQHDLSEYFKSGQSLRKLSDVELRIVVRYINRTHKIKIKESDRKETKIERLCKLLMIDYSAGDVRTSHKQTKIHQPKRLSEIALKTVSNTLKKADLNIIYSEYVWEKELKQWNEKHNRLGTNISEEVQFYYPSYSKTRNQLEVCCIDSSHLLTRMRRKSAKGGLDNLSNEAWRKVAKSKKTALSLGMVDCVLEPMTVAVANTHFSKAVEREMRENGDLKEAQLCKDIREWWLAEDEPGIAAEQRICLRSSLRKRLMNGIDFSTFPPPGMYINGWPTQLWEGIVASIDAKQILYSVTPHHKYNVRAFSSMMGETFFSELTLYDRRGQGCVTSREFGQYIDTSVEKLLMRMDPKRSFSYTTSRKKVYNLVSQCPSTETAVNHGDDGDDQSSDKSSFVVRDHEFDDPGRRRVKAKVKEAKMEADRNAIARGSLGVRWETARRNESKVLPTYRLGTDIKDIE